MYESNNVVLEDRSHNGARQIERANQIISNNSYLNDVCRKILDSTLGRKGLTITVEVDAQQNVQDILTRMRILSLLTNQNSKSVSVTVSPSFRFDTYPSMLSLVREFNRVGAGDDWSPGSSRSICVGQATHLFVSVDMPIVGYSPLPDTAIEIVNAHFISKSWYDERVRPRVISNGLTKIFFGSKQHSMKCFGRPHEGEISIFDAERNKNISGRPDGLHLSDEIEWDAVAAV